VQNNPINWVDPDGLFGLSAAKAALKRAYKALNIDGPLPKGPPGKFGSPQRGTPEKGYRLDPGHPNRPVGDPEAGPHVNWWNYTEGKRGKGGRSGAESIIGGIVGFLSAFLDPFDAIAGELASDEELMQEYFNRQKSPCE
jgi:hypothetical protein